VKGGLNIPYYSFGTNDVSLGLQIGMFSKKSLSQHSFIVSEVLLYQLCSSSEIIFTDNTGDVIGSSTLLTFENHIAINVLYKQYFTNKFNMFIGPDIDYFFYRKYDNSNKFQIFEHESINNPFNTLFLGVVVGAGYNINLSSS